MIPLFLDIDGVLVTKRTMAAFGGVYPHTFQQHPDRFDQAGLGLLRRIVKQSGAVVVLSSTWRRASEWVYLARVLDLPIIDRTPLSLDGTRGDEIKLWMDQHPEEKFTHYAILDDDDDIRPEQTEHFVRTNFNEGITWEVAQKLAPLLGLQSVYG